MAENYLDIFAKTIRNNWDQPALTDFYLTEDGSAQDTSRGKAYTYGEMYAEIVRVADLLTRLGLRKGDHIAICGANSAHWVIAYLAIAKMQGVSVTVMHTLQPDQIAQMVDFSDAKALFVDKDLWAELSPFFQEGDRGRLSNVISLEDWDVLRGEKISLPFREEQEVGFPHQESDNLAMICFTSGSTGQPKGVMISNSAANHGVDVSSNMFPADKRCNYISFLPYAHISGLFVDVIDQLLNAHHVYINNEELHLDSAIKIIKPYALTVVPMLLEILLCNTEVLFHEEGVKQITIGGAMISDDLGRKISQLHIPHVCLYAATEGLLFSHTRVKDYYENNVGKVCKGIQVSIAPNGEIMVKGENVMLGYYKDPEATAQKIDKDGWLHTGDKGHLDEDGYLYVEGRLEQDIIVLPNGENIRPDNIEALINTLPEVSESIVLARDGKLVARVVVPPSLLGEGKGVRLSILRTINPQLPLFSQLYDVEITDAPLQRTEKMTIKRYLYS